jgi:hypothetical protein
LRIEAELDGSLAQVGQLQPLSVAAEEREGLKSTPTRAATYALARVAEARAARMDASGTPAASRNSTSSISLFIFIGRFQIGIRKSSGEAKVTAPPET